MLWCVGQLWYGAIRRIIPAAQIVFGWVRKQKKMKNFFLWQVKDLREWVVVLGVFFWREIGNWG
jgi:hypothetical protein